MTPARWIRANLLGSPFNTGLTVLGLVIVAQVVPAFLDWALVRGSWGFGTPETCRQAGGACWSLLAERHRLMLFGLYPYDQHWRPLLAMGVFLALLATSTRRRCWRAWLVWAWVGGVAAMAVLMWGGILGLVSVETDKWGGLPLTLVIAVLAIFLAFPFSILLALGRRSNLPVFRALSVGYIELVRGLPLVSLLFMASVMFPLFLPEGVTIDKALRALVGMTLFTAAYLAENIRGGLQAIPKGQFEAAEALGLSYWQSMRLIILPQALRLVIPPVVNQFITCFKDTSLVTIVGLYDLLAATKAALNDPAWRPYFLEGYLAAALVYFCFCFFMSRYSQWLERDLARGTR